MRFIKTQFNTRCAETGDLIIRGDMILLDGKKAYSPRSKKFQAYSEEKSLASYIEAQENAYWDEFLAR